MLKNKTIIGFVAAAIILSSSWLYSAIEDYEAVGLTVKEAIETLLVNDLTELFSTKTEVDAVGGDLVGTTATQTLTNKTLTAPVISTISNTGTVTLPTATDTLVGKATTDTLTNKTLTAPVMSTISVGGETVTLPTATDTLVGKATTDELSNKTLVSPVLNTAVSGTAVLDEDAMGSNSDTQLATQQSIKAYVDARIPSGVILMWSGAISAIPTGWVICDGTNSTPNLTDRFVLHADADSGGTNDVGDTGGASTHSHADSFAVSNHTLTAAEMPQHRHGAGLGNFAVVVGSGGDGPLTGGSIIDETTYTDYAGSSSGHNHSLTGSVTDGANVPKYYALAYIMKT